MRRWAIVWALGVLSCAGQQRPDDSAAATVAPIPVPQPVYPREQLSTELQVLWGRVEDAVAVRPPEPPNDGTKEAIEEWADGPFRHWLELRQLATNRALSAAYALRPRPIHERGMGSALFGYMYEDLASGIRGAPVPDSIANDVGLLEIYSNALDEQLEPFADLAARAYYACLALFVKLGDPAWEEWALYCDARGGEVAETYQLEPPEPVQRPEVSGAGTADAPGHSEQSQ